MAADDFITNIVLDAAMMPPMSEKEKALRDLFVREYLIDYNAIAACLRCGFMRSFAEEYAKKFFDEPYVRQQITILSLATSRPSEEETRKEFNKARIYEGLMREAHYHGADSTQAARVSALKTLATIEGMIGGGGGGTGKFKDLNVIDNRGGVMAVPGIADATEWEEVAVKTQQKLVEDARS